MGVPSYFRWIMSVLDFIELLLTEVYPYEGSVDHLFIDYNCAIHPAVKAIPAMKIEHMYDAAIDYLKQIVKFANPSKTLYIAIDGVAPRAKMEQQRARRYKSVKEAKLIRDIKKKFGEPYEEAPIDFNMISPGTEFMTTLSAKINEFIIEMKKTEWAHLKIYFTDSSIPGEGEHKIMQYIRNNNIKSDKIAIYGLDSDLIFLSMLNCGSRTVLLRESNQFEKKNKNVTKSTQTPAAAVVAPIEFTYLSIEKLKDCIVQVLSPIVSFTELEGLKIFNDFQFEQPTNYKYQFYSGSPEDKHRITLDYVFICFLMGNDFLPHLPSLKIRDGGLDIGIQAYKVVSWKLGTYLVNKDGVTINIEFFKKLLEELVTVEKQFLLTYSEKREIRIERFEKKVKYMKPYDREIEEQNYIENKYNDVIGLGYDGWRERYYYYQFNIPFRHKVEFNKKIMPICHNFLEGMKWTLMYYQGKHNNWTWHYLYPEAPTISDLLLSLDSFDFNACLFENNAPVTPFVQLMCILPPESANLLPNEIGQLMTARDSDLHYMYPLQVTFGILNKQFMWECHPRLPPIDIDILTALIKKIHDQRINILPKMYSKNIFGAIKSY